MPFRLCQSVRLWGVEIVLLEIVVAVEHDNDFGVLGACGESTINHSKSRQVTNSPRKKANAGKSCY